jgi:hypothetical protein
MSRRRIYLLVMASGLLLLIVGLILAASGVRWGPLLSIFGAIAAIVPLFLLRAQQRGDR